MEGDVRMSTSGRAEHERVAVSSPGRATSLDQVREILVGAQYRELTRRLAHTDAHIGEQTEELRSEIKRRLEALEVHLRKELEALSASMESRRADDLQDLNSSAREVHSSVVLLEQRFKRLEEHVARVQSDLRQQMLDQVKLFIDEVRRTRDTLSAAVERELAIARGEEAVAPRSADELPRLEASEPEERGSASEAA
jgi:DNA anti-recombination protein RmuC